MKFAFALACGILAAQSTDKKIVVDLQNVPNDTRIEFLIGTDPPHLTKDQLMQAIVMFQAKRLQSDDPCVIAQSGAILNYPCKIHTVPRPVAKKKN